MRGIPYTMSKRPRLREYERKRDLEGAASRQVVYDGGVILGGGLCGDHVEDLRGGGFYESAGGGDDVEGEVAAFGREPFFVLFGEDGADQADD
jgi:hypothetical protein